MNFPLPREKKKNQDGKYSIDGDWHIPNLGYYWKEGSKIVGFSIVEAIDGYFEIVDFYIVPAYRKKTIGKNMAFAVFNKNPGPWRVRQIPGSEATTKFWRRINGEYTNKNYTESQIENPPWGCQCVSTKFIVATTGNEIVEFAEFEPNGHIDCFYCHHAWIGKGIGPAFMKEILQRAKNRHIYLIFAEVNITAKIMLKSLIFLSIFLIKVIRFYISLLLFNTISLLP